MRADRSLVVEELRLLECPGRGCDLDDRSGLRGRVGAGMPVTLWRLMHCESRLAPKIEHEVEGLAAFPGGLGTVEVDRADGCARDDALAVIAAAIEIDLVAEIDRLFRADLDAGVAARADLEIDRVFLRPARLERTQPS